jgi:hypothetical protein
MQNKHHAAAFARMFKRAIEAHDSKAADEWLSSPMSS